MLQWVFHRWEEAIHRATTDRVVREFDWGLDWLPELDPTDPRPPAEQIETYAAHAVSDSTAYYAITRPTDATLDAAAVLRFSSQITTPHPANNRVHARLFRAAADRGRAVVVLPQWNADADGHVGLCRVFNRFGLTALRLTLPYHDVRMPPELTRADFIVSSSVGRTLQVCRQAVLDARRCVAWLAEQGYTSIGICGTSLGSCLSMLTACHEPRIAAAALNHVSPFFADVVWEGLSTRHVREGLDGHVDLETLRRLWLPISPFPYIEKLTERATLLVYARYDLTFPVGLSRLLVEEFGRRGVPCEVAVLPCGHYSTGRTPFKYLDAYWLTRFLLRNLGQR